MSTKTTFKRVTLVAVAALGLSVLSSVAPANAAAIGSFSLDTTSVTVVGGGASGTALFKITTTDIAGDNAPLAAGETITATIVGVPTGTGTAKTLAANSMWGNTAALGVPATQAADLSVVSLTVPTTRTGAYVAQTHSSALTGAIGSGHTAQSDSATTPLGAVYYLGVRNNLAATSGTNSSVDQGAYTIQLRLTNSDSFVLQTSTVTVKFVTAPADSGAAITITQTGSLVKARANAYTTANNVKVAMTNGTAGGRVYASSNLTVASVTPAVAIITTSTGVVVGTSTSPADAQGLLIADTGVTAVDGVFTTQAGADLAANNNTYGVYTTATTALDTVSTTVPVSLRVRYGATETVGALTVNAAASATAAGTTGSVTATGMNVLATSGLVSVANAYKVPTSNKSVVFKISTGLADYPFIFTVTWSGNQAAADVSPVSGTTGKQTVRTDSTGVASITLTNANPQDGAIASIATTGYADDSVALAQTITWSAPVPTTVSITPGSYTAALASANTLTVSVLDQYLSPMSGVVLAPKYSATTAANYKAAPATITTGASGTASYSWTDAGVAGADTISFTSVSTAAATSSVTVTYAATAAVIASFTKYYSHDQSATTSTTLVPSTGVIVDTSTDLLINMARNQSKAIVITGTSGTDDLVSYYVLANKSATAAAAAAPVTITASPGAFVLTSSGLAVSSTTLVTGATGYIQFVGGATTTGTATYTLTAGTVSTTITASMGNASTDGRNVTLSGPATGVANGEPNLYTGTVKDRHGNAVSGANVTVNAGGASSLGGGSTSATYVTLDNGTFTFTGTSFVSAGGAGTFTATATSTGDYASIAGYVGTTSVDSTQTAGNKSASLTVTFSAGESAAAANAQAATDAAAEATDAANAATDAANAAAEAADAATAAAQDAADAVAALSAQVSSLISGLKAQLTALTNLVIKIQKKVKA